MPVVLVSGDQAAIAEVRELVPNIEGVQVKEAIGTAAARSVRPEEAARLIREGTARAVRRRGEVKPAPASLPARFASDWQRTSGRLSCVLPWHAAGPQFHVMSRVMKRSVVGAASFAE